MLGRIRWCRKFENRAVADRVHVAGGQPAEPQREDVDADEPEPEGRDRQRDHGADRRQIVERRIAVGGAADADPAADRDRDHGGGTHQQERGEEMPADHRQHRRPVAEGVAPVALQKIAGPVEILDPERPVQPQLLLEASDILLGHAGIEPELRQRAAGQEVENDEADDRDDHQQHQALREAIEQEATHAALHLCQDECQWIAAARGREGPGRRLPLCARPVPGRGIPGFGARVDVGHDALDPFLVPLHRRVLANSGRKGRS